jgi:hypothetical protein
VPSLKDVAQHVRSKAAGPFWVTIDIFCDEAAAFERVRNSSWLAGEVIGGIYGVPADAVKVFELPVLKVVKISFPRLRPQGSLHDADSHAGQYFVPLLDLPVA